MDNSSWPRRQVGAALIAGGAALLGLLIAHPQLHVHSFSQLVEFETQHRVLDAFVHGGAIAVLVWLLAAHVRVTRLIHSTRLTVILAATAFGTGCMLLTGSLVLDGLVTPALAMQFQTTQEAVRRDVLQGVMEVCGTTIGILIRVALLSFAASALAWCGSLVLAGGRSRVAGALSGVVGVCLAVLMLGKSPQVLAGLVLLGGWQVAFGIVLLQVQTRRRAL